MAPRLFGDDEGGNGRGVCKRFIKGLQNSRKGLQNVLISKLELLVLSPVEPGNLSGVFRFIKGRKVFVPD